jgi:hypothetical protein
MIRHQQAQPTMPCELLAIVSNRCQHSITDVSAAQLVLCLGTQLIVMKNQLPSAAHCGIVSGSFLRTGKSMCEV